MIKAERKYWSFPTEEEMGMGSSLKFLLKSTDCLLLVQGFSLALFPIIVDVMGGSWSGNADLAV